MVTKIFLRLDLVDLGLLPSSYFTDKKVELEETFFFFFFLSLGFFWVKFISFESREIRPGGGGVRGSLHSNRSP